MANLGEDFRNAAKELKEAALEFVAQAFNSASEKDMTAIAALQTQEIDTAEEVSGGDSLQMSRFSDELFSAVKHGDSVRVRELLDIDDSPGSTGPGLANLMEAVEEKKEDDYIKELIEIATETGDYDLSMAALLLVASGGSPTAAREMLKDINEGRDSMSNYSEAGLEAAIAKGNLAGAAIIKQRMRAIEFNQKAQSESQKEGLFEKCMNFFTRRTPAEEKQHSRFVAERQKAFEDEYEYVSKLPPEEQANFAQKMIKSITTLLDFGPKT